MMWKYNFFLFLLWLECRKAYRCHRSINFVSTGLILQHTYNSMPTASALKNEKCLLRWWASAMTNWGRFNKAHAASYRKIVRWQKNLRKKNKNVVRRQNKEEIEFYLCKVCLCWLWCDVQVEPKIIMKWREALKGIPFFPFSSWFEIQNLETRLFSFYEFIIDFSVFTFLIPFLSFSWHNLYQNNDRKKNVV